MNIIFAVPDHKNATYQQLSHSISGSSTGTLENDSQNVVALVSSEYEVIIFVINNNTYNYQFLYINYIFLYILSSYNVSHFSCFSLLYIIAIT